MKKKYFIILSFIVLLIIGVGIYTLQQKLIENVGLEQAVPQKVVDKIGKQASEEVEVRAISIPDVDTSAWQTYRNEEFGFAIKYPEDRIGVERSGSFYIHSAEDVFAEQKCREGLEKLIRSGVNADYGPCLFGIFITVQSEEEWMEQYLIETSYPLPAVEGVLKLNRDFYPPALVIAIPVPQRQDRDRFIVFEAYDIYREDGSRGENGTLLRQVLSTFRFIEK
ncbi:MAG: hypothetical protein HYS52_02045 [Candidatus Wildermuthbacteria bacterium]|nr:hypothetical protein [Candidatus Wildermuthbacteria bacterium]